MTTTYDEIKKTITPSYSESKEFGVKFACALHGVSEEDYIKAEAQVKTIENPETFGYGVLQKRAAAVAAATLSQLGLEANLEYHIYNRLSKVAHWHPAYDEFMLPVYHAIAQGKGNARKEALDKRFEKNANPGAGAVLSKVLQKIGLGAPSVAKVVLGAGAATGAGLGSLAWYLNRDSKSDRADMEAMKERIRHYNRAKRELNKDFARTPSVEITPEEKSRIKAITQVDDVYSS